MTEPTERRFVMEPRLDAEIESINDAIALKANLTDPRLTDERTPLDDSVTSAKIVNGTIVNADVSDTAAIAYTKVTRPPLSNASDVAIDAGTLAGGQVIKYNAGTSNWVNGAAAGGVTASATAPTLATAAAGDAWFDTNDGTLYVCYVDVDSTKQWVQVQANSALEGSILARLGALESQSIAYGTMSPNYVINGGFDVWQRGTTSTANIVYLADRWLHLSGAGTQTVSRSTDVPTDSGLTYSLSFASTSGTNPTIIQRIESANSASIAGKTVTLSLWAKSTVGTVGLGWSTSVPTSTDTWTGSTADKSGTFTATMTVGSWVRYTATFVVVSTASTGYQINIVRNATTTSTTTLFAGVQLERGSVATSFRRNAPSIQGELAACQRYYWRATATATDGRLALGVQSTTTTSSVLIYLPSEFRIKPKSVGYSSLAWTDNFSFSATVSAATLHAGVNSKIVTVELTHATAGASRYPGFVSSPGGAGYLEFSAEL